MLYLVSYEDTSTWLTCLPNKTIKLQLLIDVKVSPEKVKIKFNHKHFKLKAKGAKTVKMRNFYSYLELPQRVNAVSHNAKPPLSGDPHKIELEIENIKEFIKEKAILAMVEKRENGKAENVTVGKAFLVPNAPTRHQKLDVTFVNVKTKLSTNSTEKIMGVSKIAADERLIKKYCAQAYIKPTFKTVELDLRADSAFNKTHVASLGSGKNKTYYIPFSTSLLTYLESKVSATTNASAYKVFFFNEKSGYIQGSFYQGLNGAAKSINSKSVFVSNTKQSGTVTHELFHAMGLHHTFGGQSTFILKKHTTDNLMDYSHQIKIKRISTAYWQWKIINKQIK